MKEVTDRKMTSRSGCVAYFVNIGFFNGHIQDAAKSIKHFMKLFLSYEKIYFLI